MAGAGTKWQPKSEEFDRKLITQIKTGKKLRSLEIAMGMSITTINKRLREMGYEGLSDARRVLCN
jgi:DNA-binding MurR/RpiR family transcriptional regulator